MIGALQDTYRRLVAGVPLATRRFLCDTFAVTGRLVGLIGPRGAGKTTLLLQYLRDRPGAAEDTFYASADHIYFNRVTLLDFVRELFSTQGTTLFVFDEIHKYDGWEQELKNIHDSFPAVRVVFSGSSSLSLTKGGYDLSRRTVLYHLPGLSFREYLNFATGERHDPVPLSDVLRNPGEASARLAQIPKLAGHFRRYLREGYYPYVFDDGAHHYDKVRAVVDKTIYEDVATYYRLKTENLHCFRKILYFLATIPPGAVNAHKLGASLGVNDKTAVNYLTILQETGLVRLLLPDARGHALIRKPHKTYLDNTTLYHAVCEGIGQDVETGTIRELFFLASAQNAGHTVSYGEEGGDFRIGGAVFEVGGRGKGTRQLASVRGHAYVVKDDVLAGNKNTIPLYLMGFLY
jgi:predicted AAA+ superfamily ATPase